MRGVGVRACAQYGGTCAGTIMRRCTDRRNSMRKTRLRSTSARPRGAGRGAGRRSASHALSDHASEAITMYAQFDSSVVNGARSAATPPLNWAGRFSWLPALARLLARHRRATSCRSLVT